MMKIVKLSILLIVITLSACGGDSGDSSTAPGNGGTPGLPTVEAKEYSLQPQALVLNSSSSSVSTVFIDDTTLVLKGDTSGITVGKVLISTEGNGFLRKVVSISNTPEGLKLVTEQASLAEAFSKLNIQIDKVFGPADFGQIIETGTPEIGLEFRNTAVSSQLATGVEISGPELSLTFKNFGASGNSGVEIAGDASFKVNPQWDISLEKINEDRSILKYQFGISPNYRHSFTAKSKFGGSISMLENKDIVLGRYIIPNTPIVVVPTLILEANAKGSAAGAFGTTYTASMAGGASVQRDITGNTTTSTTYQPLQTAKFDLAESTLSASVTPISRKLEFRLYGIAGPNFGFDAVGEMSGTLERNTQTSQEGIRAIVVGKFVGNIGAGGKIPFIERFFGKIDGGFSLVNVPLSIAEAQLANEFFPFSGTGGITVFDNGNVPDDIFEVSLDGLVLGRTSKGGSGQFRLSSLRPGSRQLTLKTVEDDAPPGTYAITLGEGLTFADGGGTQKIGLLSLGNSTSYSISVPSK